MNKNNNIKGTLSTFVTRTGSYSESSVVPLGTITIRDVKQWNLMILSINRQNMHQCKIIEKFSMPTLNFPCIFDVHIKANVQHLAYCKIFYSYGVERSLTKCISLSWINCKWFWISNTFQGHLKAAFYLSLNS